MIRRHYRRWLVLASVLVLPLLWASGAQAISMIKVREIYAGTNNDSYVELQAFAELHLRGRHPCREVPDPLRRGRDSDAAIHLHRKKRPRRRRTRQFLVGDTGVQEHFRCQLPTSSIR